MDKISFNNKGFTLVEVVAVIAILGIIAGFAVVSVDSIIWNSKVDVCNVNTSQLERKYKEHLALKSIEHSDLAFTQYMHEYGADICPEDGVISYLGGEVRCSVHDGVDGGQDSEEEDDGGVPYL